MSKAGRAASEPCAASSGKYYSAAGMVSVPDGCLAEPGDVYSDRCHNPVSSAYTADRLVWNEFCQYAGASLGLWVSCGDCSCYPYCGAGNYLFQKEKTVLEAKEETKWNATIIIS